jgi:hypothetical protein
MSKVLEYTKAALQIAFGILVLAIMVLKFQGLYRASQKFLERAASVSAIKVLGVEIDLNATGVNRALFRANYLTGADKSRVLALIHGLDPKEFVRLMYVGQLKGLCEFDKPSTEMRSDVALDYGLRARAWSKSRPIPRPWNRCGPIWPS